MARFVKKISITQLSESYLYTVTLQSENILPEYLRLHAYENVFPTNATPEKPLNHVVVISSFTLQDLALLRTSIDKFLKSENYNGENNV